MVSWNDTSTVKPVHFLHISSVVHADYFILSNGSHNINIGYFTGNIGNGNKTLSFKYSQIKINKDGSWSLIVMGTNVDFCKFGVEYMLTSQINSLH